MRKEQTMMKRTLMLLAVAVIFGLAACTAADPGTVVPGEYTTSFGGVAVRILSAERTREKGTVLEVRWSNDTDYEILYGESFGIQRLEGETWVDCDMRKNTGFESIGYGLQPHSQTTKSYSLDWVYDVSKAGTYRFTTDCYVYDTNEGTKCELWAEFTVGSVTQSLEIAAQYIRTDGYHEGRKYPRAALLSDRKEFMEYYESSRDFYSLDDFYNACHQYDENFFSKYDLLMVLVEEGSGSILHTVRALEYTDGTISVQIDRAVPEVVTDDMAQWHILIPVEKQLQCEAVRVFLDGNLALEDTAVIPNISWAAGEYKTPPALTVSYDGGSFEATQGTCTWNCANGDGTWTGVCADSPHPLQMKDHLPLISAGDSQVRLIFEDWPDSYTVRCWPDSQWGNTDAVGEAVMQWNHTFELRSGGYIYEVAATWNDDGSPYHGTASYVFYMAPAMLYPHMYAVEPQTVSDPVTGWCGNTLTTIHLAGEAFTFMGGESVTLSSILVNLKYDPQKVCRCAGEYLVDSEFEKGYEINLSQAFVRCSEGQADLTREQVETIQMIIEWAEKETKAR